jgi:hypothetical protein
VIKDVGKFPNWQRDRISNWKCNKKYRERLIDRMTGRQIWSETDRQTIEDRQQRGVVASQSRQSAKASSLVVGIGTYIVVLFIYVLCGLHIPFRLEGALVKEDDVLFVLYQMNEE